MILHISTRDEWATARAAGQVTAPSLDEVGFLHCSDPGTIHLPADRIYPGRTDLVLLEIDPVQVTAEVRWEAGDPPMPGGPWFPHVYGPVEIAAVVGVHDFPPNPDGGFTLPATLTVR